MSLHGLKSFFFVVVFNTLSVVGVLYAFHAYYRFSIKAPLGVEESGLNETIGEDLFFRLGHFLTEKKKSSFLHFSVEKPTGVTRIGVFGDSNTFGDEVDLDGDFPTQLQALLGDGFEVLNFGQPWYSTAQSYILWQEFHKKYDLDIVVFGPRGLYPERNLTFNHTFDLFPSALHSRFIIVDDQLQEIKPSGENQDERFEYYYSFIPSRDYRLYDQRPPSFLKAYSYFFKRDVDNPFYYFDNKNTEHLQLIQLFLRSMAIESKRFVLINDNAVDDLDSFAWVTQEFIQSSNHIDFGFPFRALKGHSSVFGNRLTAWELAHHFYPKRFQPIKKLSDYLTFDEADHFKNDAQKGSQALALSRLTIELDSQPIASLVSKEYFDPLIPAYLIGIQCQSEHPVQAFYLRIDREQFEANLAQHAGDQRLLKHQKIPNLFLYNVGDCQSEQFAKTWKVSFTSSSIRSQDATAPGYIAWGDLVLLNQLPDTVDKRKGDTVFKSDWPILNFSLDANVAPDLFLNQPKSLAFSFGMIEE